MGTKGTAAEIRMPARRRWLRSCRQQQRHPADVQHRSRGARTGPTTAQETAAAPGRRDRRWSRLQAAVLRRRPHRRQDHRSHRPGRRQPGVRPLPV